MIIAVNTRILPADFPDDYRYFIYETFKRIAGNNPSHQFIFITENKDEKSFAFGSNTTTSVISPAGRHSLLWKLWYDVKLPALLKKIKADIFISCDGICSLTAKIPQCLLLPDLGFLLQPSVIKKSYINFYKKNTPRFLDKAKAIVTLSEFYKQEIINQYKTEASKIAVVYSGAGEFFKPLAHEEKQSIKSQYTEEREYFLYKGEIHPRKNIIHLVKAFSVFKKRQQTNMKLVLAGKLADSYGSFKEDLKSYKYRNDVVLTGELEEKEQANITGAAYGVVYPSAVDGFAVPVLEALRCEVPVIIPDHGAMKDIVKEAALYADASSHTAIADKMMLLYKDENKRKELIQEGKTVSIAYNWDNTAALLWKAIQKAAGETL